MSATLVSTVQILAVLGPETSVAPGGIAFSV